MRIKYVLEVIRFFLGRCSECGTKHEVLPGFWGGCSVCPKCHPNIEE
jgi:hypothetical protein